MALFEGWWVFLLLSLSIGFYTVFQLLKYTNWRKMPWYVLLSSWIGWFFSFGFVFLIPFDIASSAYPNCTDANPHCYQPYLKIDPDVLKQVWLVIYWTTFILCWAIYPLMQSYATAPEFKFLERIWKALKENLIFYGISAIVCVILLIVVLATSGLKFARIWGIGIAAGTAWGLFVLFLLLGYGLAQIPIKLWKQGNRLLVLKDFYLKAHGRKQHYEATKKEYEDSMKAIKRNELALKDHTNNAVLAPFMETILKKMPPTYLTCEAKGDINLTYDGLVQLHGRFMVAEQEYAIAESVYKKLLRTCYRLEDILRSRRYPKKKIIWTVPKKRNENEIIDTIEWAFHLHIIPFLYRVLAFFCLLTSFAIVFSEVLFWVTKIDLSLVSRLVNSESVSSTFTGQVITSFLPVFYMAVCAYFSFFQVHISSYFRLIPLATDPYSLLYSASYLCRLGAPLAYNFTMLIHDTDTQFHSVMGDITVTPLLGNEFTLYFPMFLLILFIASFFDVYNRVINIFRKQEAIDKDIETGQNVIALERELFLKQLKANLPEMAFEKIPMTEIELEIHLPWREKTKTSDSVSKSLKDIKARYKPAATSPTETPQPTTGTQSIRDAVRGKLGGRKKEDTIELIEKP